MTGTVTYAVKVGVLGYFEPNLIDFIGYFLVKVGSMSQYLERRILQG